MYEFIMKIILNGSIVLALTNKQGRKVFSVVVFWDLVDFDKLYFSVPLCGAPPAYLILLDWYNGS